MKNCKWLLGWSVNGSNFNLEFKRNSYVSVNKKRNWKRISKCPFDTVSVHTSISSFNWKSICTIQFLNNYLELCVMETCTWNTQICTRIVCSTPSNLSSLIKKPPAMAELLWQVAIMVKISQLTVFLLLNQNCAHGNFVLVLTTLNMTR